MRGRFARAVVTAGVLALISVPLPRAAATQGAADPSYPTLPGTPIPGFASRQVPIVATDSRVYVASGANGTTIQIMYPDGTAAGTIDGIPGPTGMTIVGQTLFVSAWHDAAIHRYDLSTDPPTTLASFPVAPLIDPNAVVYAGGRLWYVAETAFHRAQLGSMTLAGTGSRTFDPALSHAWECNADGATIEATPTLPNQLLVNSWGFEECSEPFPVDRYDVSTNPPTLLGSFDIGVENVVPDPSGTRYLYAGGTQIQSIPIDFTDASTSEMAYTYPAPYGWFLAPTLATTTADGGWVAAIARDRLGQDQSERVILWRPGVSTPAKIFEIGPVRPYRERLDTIGDVAFGPAGDLDLVTDYWTENPTVSDNALFFTYPGHTAPLTLRPSLLRDSYGARITLTATLTPDLAGETVSIYRRVASNPPKTVLIGTPTIGPDGTATVTDRPPRTCTYRAVFAGDSVWGATQTKAFTETVHVALVGSLLRAYGTQGKYKVYRQSQYVYYLASTWPVLGSHVLKFGVERYQRGWHLVFHAELKEGRFGRLIVYLRPGLPRGLWRIRVRTDGMVGLLGTLVGTVAPWAYFKVI